MTKFFKFKILFLLSISFFLLLPYFANAQSISFISNKSSCKVGDDIQIVLSLNTSDKLINVVDGTVSFPKEFFDVQNIKYSDSILALWVKNPIASDDGNISFTGGIPHGFNGSNGNIFSFTLKAKKIGETVISISNAAVLLNDGLGTELKGVTLAPLNIKIVSADKNSSATVIAAPAVLSDILPVKINKLSSSSAKIVASSKVKTASKQQLAAKDKKNKKIIIKNVKKN